MTIRSTNVKRLGNRTLLACALALSSQAMLASEDAPALNLHVPSPDWRDQVIYFVMIDRFNDGDPSNNDQGANEYNPRFESHYSGGDIAGISAKLDYIQTLGATSLWITPPVANQWWFKQGNYGGYHGYWARDFTAIDEHYGTLADYQQLSHQLHNRGMYLIQDIVVNHTGNFFGYDGPYDPQNTADNFYLYPAHIQSQQAPEQAPFDAIDRNNPEHVAADIYNWTPGITDYDDPAQELTYQLASLADINTRNPVVRESFKQTYSDWIRNVGVDAFRIDTVKYVEHDFWHDFMHAENGIHATAAATGREHFLAFGEVFNTSLPMQNNGEKKLVSFLGTEYKPELNSVIGFPLFGDINQVLAEGHPTRQLAYRLEQHMLAYPDPFVIPNFVDNHDTKRFLASGNLQAFKQAMATIMTVPGIPVVYQGDEQAHTVSRQAMFAGGYKSKGKHSFDTESDMFKFVQQLINVRTRNKVFSRGDLQILSDDAQSAGTLAWQRSYAGQRAIIVMNSADEPRLLANLPVALSDQQQLRPLLEMNLDVNSLTRSEQGQLTGILAPRALGIYLVDESTSVTSTAAKVVPPRLNQSIDGRRFSQSLTLSGQSEANSQVWAIINGNTDQAVHTQSDADGHFTFNLPIQDLGEQQHQLQLYLPEHAVAGIRSTYTSAVTQAQVAFSITDKSDDGFGPKGQYQNPQHSVSGQQREIIAADIQAAGANLNLTLTMADLSTAWEAQNAFDNVSFNIFISDGSKQGISALPGLNAAMPKQLNWQWGHALYGWGNSVFTAQGADAHKPGKKLAAAPTLQVNTDTNTLKIAYQGRALGISDWHGYHLYITTWDKSGEGDLRPLAPQASAWSFGGGKPDDAKIMDSLLISIPAKDTK